MIALLFSLLSGFLAVAAIRVGLAVRATRGLPAILGSDEAFHSNLIRGVREAGHRGVGRLRGYETMKRQVYPWGYHWLLSFVPPERLARAGSLFGTVTDLILLVATAGIGLWAGRGQPGWLACLLALFLATPLLTRERTGKLTLRERPLGMLLVSLVFLILVAHHLTNSGAALVAAVVLASFVPVTSKFGLQALLGHCVLAGLLLGRPEWVALPFASFGLSVVWSRGEAARFFGGQYRHLRLFWTDIYAGFATVRDRYGVDALWKRGSFRTRRRRIAKLLRRHPLALLFSGIPLFPLVALAGLSPAGAGDPLRTACIAWFGASALLFVLTSFGRLRIFGQAERYFDASVPAYLLLATDLLVSSRSWLAGGLVLAGLLIAADGFRAQRTSLRASAALAEGAREALEWLERERPGARILTVPINWANYAVAFTTGEALDAMGILMEGDAERFRWLLDGYPWPVADLAGLAREANIDAVLTRRNPRADAYDWSAFSEAYANEICRVMLPRPDGDDPGTLGGKEGFEKRLEAQ